ncbi:hypothetical protein [Streptomyces triculaminicus]|uniref:hypothetical protein n=1 Tax=Streptomyces triculaminicus TaxID=2816232 RepID=UPI0037CCF694
MHREGARGDPGTRAGQWASGPAGARGVRAPLPASPSVTGALAPALSAPVTELTGQPYPDQLRADQLDGLIQPVREALNIYDLGPDPDVVPRPVEELVAHADKLCAMVGV